MKLGIEIKGQTAANISRLFRVPITATYNWPEDKRVIVVRGVVTEPARYRASDPTTITSKTREVRLRNVTQTEQKGDAQPVPALEDEHHWTVDTPLITIQL